MIYLASPYTHEDKTLRRKRYQQALHLCATLIKNHVPIYSPIVHFHNIAELFNLPPNFEFWKDHNENMILRSNGIWVYTMEGWLTSKGVQHEISFAKENNITIAYIKLDPDGQNFRLAPSFLETPNG